MTIACHEVPVLREMMAVIDATKIIHYYLNVVIFGLELETKELS
jgi:hypothetical protein